MYAEELLVSALSSNAGIVAIVGTRIFPEIIPEETELPAIAYSRPQSRPFWGLGSSCLAEEFVFEIGLYAYSKETAQQLSNLVKSTVESNGFGYTNRQSGFDPETFSFSEIVEASIFMTF